jgi:shikimate dehydrogenase
LLGEKLGHSRSPEIHRLFGDYSYRLFEKTPAEVREFLLHGDFDAINVTIPYKRTAFEFCDEVTSEAEKLGNVNVVVRRGGKLFGDNTDGYGFKALVDSTGVDVRGLKCTVLGSGGAAATARRVLEDADAAQVVTVSRSGEDNYENLSRHADTAVLVNATPVGMFPDVDAQPVSLSSFPECEAVVDLIYNPSPTKLLAEAADRGIPNIGGMLMLEEQARLASIYMNANLYLYGAPGSGKSTYAKRLAVEKSMPLVDLDAEIERCDGRSIPEIFAQDGEASFRAKEKTALKKAAASKGQIVALGGGALLDPECRRIAESTGRVVFIECPESVLLERVAASRDRPLLAGDAAGRMRRLLAARREHYASFTERIQVS